MSLSRGRARCDTTVPPQLLVPHRHSYWDTDYFTAARRSSTPKIVRPVGAENVIRLLSTGFSSTGTEVETVRRGQTPVMTGRFQKVTDPVRA
jgi:hypothetical protein